MDTPSTPANPYNDQPTVRLLDQAGAFVAHVSQRQASLLLRAGHADLILEVPPAVRLSIPTTDYLALSTASLPESTAKGQFLHARRAALYGNVRFAGPDGQTMFHADSEKVLWYLNRGLVEVVSQSPPLLRFIFAPGGKGHAGDDFYLARKANRCVVCGAEERLNRHHVIPSVYRRHLPPEVKDHSHHDVVLLCLACHEKYEHEADRLKADLGQEFGVPLHGLRGERDRDRGRAVKLAFALVRHGEQIPQARKEEMRQAIGKWLGKSPIGDADIEEVARRPARAEDGEMIEHGQHVVSQTSDVQAFIQRWRQHFLRTMGPRFLSEHWDVGRPARAAAPSSSYPEGAQTSSRAEEP